MKKRAQEIYHKQLGKILLAYNKKTALQELDKLTDFADILDSSGAEKDADHVDKVSAEVLKLIKEADVDWFGGLLSGAGGVAKKLWNYVQTGKSPLNKDALVQLITEFLLDTGIGIMASEIVDVITKKVPVLKWFADSTVLKAIATGALTYAVRNTDFVSKMVDGFIVEVEKTLGIKAEEAQPHQKEQLQAKPEITQGK